MVARAVDAHRLVSHQVGVSSLGVSAGYCCDAANAEGAAAAGAGVLMARDDYYMGSLAGLDAYRGDEPAWPDAPMGSLAEFRSNAPPLPSHAPEQPLTRGQAVAGAVGAMPANIVKEAVGTPAAMLAQNPYKEGTEEAEYFDQSKYNMAAPWARGMALNTVGAGTFGGVKPLQGRLGTGGGAIVQPQPIGELAKPFYSAAEQAVVASPLTKAPPEQWLGTLRNTPGVKADELERLGLEQFLRQQQGAVPKQTLADYVAANKVAVGEVRKREPMGLNDAERLDASGGRSKFQQWQLPGGENYRETLLTMPMKKDPTSPEQINNLARTLYETYERRGGDPPWERIAPDVQEIYRSRAQQKSYLAENPAAFTAGHFSEPNVLAHYRTNDRVIDGKKTLFLEEVQSDWHQKGREHGYNEPNPPLSQNQREMLQRERNMLSDRIQNLGQAYTAAPVDQRPAFLAQINAAQDRMDAIGASFGPYKKDTGIPDAPFKTTWHELALKRAIRDAAEGGYDQIAWTPGSVQNARYDLSKQVNKVILTHQKGEKGGYLTVYDKNGHQVMDKHLDISEKELPDIIGKEATKKLLEQESKKDRSGMNFYEKTLEGNDLSIGGEGMRGFYDKMLPAAANKLGKKHGAQVGQAEMVEPEMKISYEELQRRRSGESQFKPTVHTVHTLPITPSLRETALRKGFPLFTAGAATTMGALAARDTYNE
jgi:hypothetical protein